MKSLQPIWKSGTWWRHQMESFSALLALCEGNSPVTGEFPSQRLVMRSFDIFFDMCLNKRNKRLSKQSWGWWFETLSCSLCRHLYAIGSRWLDLTHWGRVTHICVSRRTIIASDNGLSPGRRQAIIWTNAGILLIRNLGTNFGEILIEIITFSFKKMRLKVSSAKRRPFCLGLNVL